MHFFTNEGSDKTEDKNSKRNECFGWWLSDILSEPLDYLKNDVYDSGVFSEKLQLASDESLTSGSQWDRYDLNGKVSGLEIGGKDNSPILSENNGYKNNAKYTLLTSVRSNLRIHKKSRTPKKNKISDDSPSGDTGISSPISTLEENKQRFAEEGPCGDLGLVFSSKLLSLINPESPNRKQLVAILNDTSSETTNSSVPLYDENTNQNECSTENSDHIYKRHCKTKRNSKKVPVSSIVGAMVHTAEHETTDKELEEPRGRFLKTASALDSKLRNLEADIQQLHTDTHNLNNDFQMQENAVSRMTEAARRLVSDLQNIRYLDDLIYLLQGQLDRITLRKWPFILAHVLPQSDSTQEFNLIV
ncbi:hypothetical protein C0J52_20535 [Blattella germanica]|nr:hypothetical protein C0J52_20535 [Blattella germanica]